MRIRKAASQDRTLKYLWQSRPVLQPCKNSPILFKAVELCVGWGLKGISIFAKQ